MTMTNLFENMNRGAVISECGNYRYQLWRIWDDSKPKVLFVMLNPSTADANKDDATIRRCMAYARSWGYGGFYVGNLCAFRSRYPGALLYQADPFGESNSLQISMMLHKCKIVVCAWGNAPVVRKLFAKGDEFLTLQFLDAKLHYLELAKTGTPKHPLYLKKDLRPIPFK